MKELMKPEMCVYSGRQQGKQEPYNEAVYLFIIFLITATSQSQC